MLFVSETKTTQLITISVMVEWNSDVWQQKNAFKIKYLIGSRWNNFFRIDTIDKIHIHITVLSENLNLGRCTKHLL